MLLLEWNKAKPGRIKTGTRLKTIPRPERERDLDMTARFTEHIT